MAVERKTELSRHNLLHLSGCSISLREKGIAEKDLMTLQSAIQEMERVKIGHELHDGLAPLLVVAKTYLGFVGARTKAEIFAKQQVLEMILSAIDNVRSVSSELVAYQKIESGLVQLVSELVNRVKGIGAFKISFTHCPETRLSKLSAPLKMLLYRIVQEQMNNIIKHSKATKVTIKMFCCQGMIRLSIADNGVGFDPMRPVKGIGLENMATRLKPFKGDIKIISSPGNGCLVNIALPMT